MEAVEYLENGAYGREDSRVEDLMQEYGLEEPSDLQNLDADKFREFEALREDIARKDIEIRDLGTESRFHFGEQSEEEKFRSAYKASGKAARNRVRATSGVQLIGLRK